MGGREDGGREGRGVSEAQKEGGREGIGYVSQLHTPVHQGRLHTSLVTQPHPVPLQHQPSVGGRNSSGKVSPELAAPGERM